MTLDDLCLRASQLTGLSDATGSEERTFLEDVANEGVREVLLETRIYVASDTISLTANTSEYAFPTDILAVLDWDQPSDSALFTVTQAMTTDVLRRRHAVGDGTVTQFTLLGANLLIVTPTPSADGTLTVYAIPLPTEMTLGSHDPSSATYGGIPVWAHNAILAWMCKCASERNRDFQAVQYWQDRFDKECGKARRRARDLAGRIPAAPSAGYPSRPIISFRNDVYPNLADY